MTTLETIRQTVIDWIEDDSDETVEVIDRTINSQLRYMAKTNEFDALFKSADATPGSDGVIIAPPVCNTILGIYPVVANGELATFEFFPSTSKRPRSDVARTNRYLYRPYESTRSDAISGIALSGTTGSATLTGASVTSAMDDKELVIAGDSTRYLIASVVDGVSMTVFPSYRGTTSATLVGRITPSGTKRYILTDPYGNEYTDDVTIDYQIEHPPLVLDDDQLLIPMERTLSLMVVQQFLQQSKYDVDAQRLENAIFEARLAEYGTEPTSRSDAPPRDSMFAFRSKRTYGARRWC